MNIHEYQAKQVLKQFGVPVPQGHVAFSADEAVAAAEKLGSPDVMSAWMARKLIGLSRLIGEYIS